MLMHVCVCAHVCVPVHVHMHVCVHMHVGVGVTHDGEEGEGGGCRMERDGETGVERKR